MSIIYRLLLTFNATSLILVIFFVKERWRVIDIIKLNSFNCISENLSFFIYCLVPLILTVISLWFSKYLGYSNIKKGSITEIENVNNAFLPSYLGYFFVALSINDFQTLIFVFCLIFIFTFVSQTLYFNPIFLIFGYKFYNVCTNNKSKLFIITKNEITNIEELEFNNLKRINNFTFIDKSKKVWITL